MRPIARVSFELARYVTDQIVYIPRVIERQTTEVVLRSRRKARATIGGKHASQAGIALQSTGQNCGPAVPIEQESLVQGRTIREVLRNSIWYIPIF